MESSRVTFVLAAVSPMLSLLRIVTVVAVLTYLSPLREDAALPGVDAAGRWIGEAVTGAAGPKRAADGAALWEALPEPARRALLDEVAASLKPAPAPALPPARDTLTADDLRPAWRPAKVAP